ncbi:MAG TPA: GNAT family N-acetyltransferase [Pilimelia sp.]|nr:GNAT family N-acetyltransferase [Pilimelia sp.]
MTAPEPELFARIERFYDAVPRDVARAETYGGLVLFAREGPGWPYYARPRLDATEPPSAADIMAVRARQVDLGLPEAFEWVHETTPDLLAVARSAGLSVLEAPLMVLDHAALPDPSALASLPIRILDPDDPAFAGDLAVRRAIAHVGFGAPGTALGSAGPAERDAAIVTLPASEIADERRRAATLRIVSALAESPRDGAVASGILQRVGDVAEVAGVATLPSARRRGLGAAITAALARHALASGVDLLLLSAGSDDIARVYVRVGFRRIGTACIAEPAVLPVSAQP